MKKIFTVLFLLSSIVWGQVNLSAGDIAIVGFNFDNPDEFSFVLLKDILASTEIKFTDNGWKSDNTFRDNEGIVTWTAPSGGLIAGQVVTISNDGGWAATYGSVISSGSFLLATSGDQILAYQGDDSSPTFIYALNSEGTGWQADATSSNTSALPMGLTNGNTAVALNEIDNSVYTGRTDLEPADLLLAVGNTANWSGSNSTRQTMPSGIWPLPVELTTFSASVVNNNVELSWETATEVNNFGFSVERKPETGDWSELGFIEGHGNSNSPKHYTFTDSEIGTGKYFYRLKQVDIDGSFEYSDAIEVDMDSPVKYELSQNFPNPFNPTTSIQFSLPETGKVKLAVYNVIGEQVAVLVNKNMEAGFHNARFDASKLNSGIYIYKLEANNFTQIRKMMLVK